MSKTVIELQNIKRNFRVGDETVHALRGVSFTITESGMALSFLFQNNPLSLASLASSPEGGANASQRVGFVSVQPLSHGLTP